MVEPATPVPTPSASDPSSEDTELGAESGRPPFPRRPVAMAARNGVHPITCQMESLF